MSTPVNHFKLGLFTLVGVALIIVAIFLFGARSYFKSNSLYETYFPGEVTGLAVGSVVELRGVRVGKVTAINFSWVEYQNTDPSYIVVQFEMRDDIIPSPSGKDRDKMIQQVIRRGLRARLKNQGVTGSSFLSLEYMDPIQNPEISVPWTPKYTCVPAAGSQLGELLSSVEKTLHNLQQLDFSNINQLVQYDLKSAGRVLDRAGEVDFGGISTNAECLLAELRSSNTKLHSLLANADNVVDQMNLRKLSSHIDDLVMQLQSTALNLKHNLANVDFESLNQTLDNARRALDQANEVLSQLKQYPSGFLWGSPPPAIKNVQPSTP